MAVPCMTRATPIPRRRWGDPLTWCHWGSLYLPAQPMAAAPCWAHSSSPQAWMGSGWRGVGVGHIGMEAEIGRFPVGSIAHVERHALVPGIAGDGESVAAVGAGVAQAVHLIGGG